MIIGTAGHIDHGKTALVKALTGVDADRLAEEKARGITIDLGYAYTPLSNGKIIGFVDMPGHEKFIHNMLAGVTGIDFALLVVAADDGIMPQTLEHLQIINLLGIHRGAVALTKSDLVSQDRIAQVSADIRALFGGTAISDNLVELSHAPSPPPPLPQTGKGIIKPLSPEGRGVGERGLPVLQVAPYLNSPAPELANYPIFPVSTITGNGIRELWAYLEKASTVNGTKPNHGYFRLAVDRCFTVAGAGTVVTGTVFSGRVAIGDKLMVSPSGREVRVKGIHAQNQASETGMAGQRCALNLAHMQKQDIQRGDWILNPTLHLPTHRLDVRIKLLASETKPLQHWTPISFHLGAFHTSGRIALLRDEPLEPGDSALAQLVLDKPTCAVNGDRCILRDTSAQRTLAGGIVLDTQPPMRGRRTARRLAILSAWEQSDPQTKLQALLAVSPEGVDLKSFAAIANLNSVNLEGLCQNLILRRFEGGKLIAFAPGHWTQLSRAVVETLRQEHETAPDSLGLNAEQLRLRVAPRLARAIFAQVLAETLDNRQCAKDGSWWHLPGHKIILSEPDEKLWHRIAPLLLASPFQPPRVRDIAHAESLDEAVVRKLFIQVARIGRVYRVAHDHYFHRGAVAQLAELFRELACDASDGSLSAAQFRDRIGTGRKLAIHILEYFDRIGYTRRFGDLHRLRENTLQF